MRILVTDGMDKTAMALLLDMGFEPHIRRISRTRRCRWSARGRR